MHRRSRRSRRTAKSFQRLLQGNASDFPKRPATRSNGRRIQQTFPLHPELFDRLYEDWSSLERFQRTRGVLRLMNAVIHACGSVKTRGRSSCLAQSRWRSPR